MNPNELRELLNDPLVAPRVAVENLMLVGLGLRSCSQTTIPAELPSGPSMGEEIDARFKPRLEKLRAIQDQRAKIKEIGEMRKGMATAFDDLVEGSAEYKSLSRWAKKLDLRVNQVDVRPTVHEFYLYKEKETLKELQRLMQERGKLRVEAVKKPDPSRGQLQFAYPEEFNGAWIRRMGRLLGYPDCCVDRYAIDREQGINAEARAAAQLKELTTDPDPHAYLSSYFFPCSPTCVNAVEKGELYHHKLSEALPEAGEAYEVIIVENLDRVRRQPEIINEYLSRLRGV
ncbi:MAG: DUF483 domain-containing protein [Candidatus Bathyarchaeota archaeon]|nr:DUF483 domain-containing protein [Candidatus Bathyarchaeota archaeon]